MFSAETKNYKVRKRSQINYGGKKPIFEFDSNSTGDSNLARTDSSLTRVWIESTPREKIFIYRD